MKQYIYPLALFTITSLASSALLGQTDCDPNGNGNPNSNQDTEGTGEGHNLTTGDIAWDQVYNRECYVEDDVPVLKNYDPANNCNNSSYLIPEAGNRRVGVAIIDSGVRPTSPGKFNQHTLMSFTVSSSGVVNEGVAFPHPHGTASAGVISGMLTRFNPIRNTPQHTFVSYQVLDTDLKTSLTAVVAAIDHAVSKGVQLISLSIGFVPTDCDNIDWESPNSPLNAAIINAENNGVIVITSAGNNEADLDENPQYPAAYTTSNLVSVGALSCEGDVPSSFSNFSENVVDVFTTGDYVQVYYNGCFFPITGTSFATSIVAGKAAIHLTKTSNTSKVLCLLRSQTKPFYGNQQYAIYGIVDVPEGPEGSVCANGQTYDPNGNEGSPVNSFIQKSANTNSATLDKADFKLTASPNPFSDQLQLNIENADDSGAMVVLYDGQGRQVLNRQVFKPAANLDLGHLPAGIYRLVVRNEAGSQTRTIVKK